MQRLLVLILAAGLVASAAAWPGLSGGRGLFRVQDARSEGNWNGSLMLQGLNGSYTYDQVFEPWRIGMLEGTKFRTADLVGTVSVSPCRWFELFCWGGGAVEAFRYVTDVDSLNLGYHNLAPGAKLSLPVLPVVKLGALGTYSMYPNFGDTRGGWSVDEFGAGRFGLPFVNGIAWTGLATFAFSDLVGWAPALHLNYGQAYDSYTRGETEVNTTYTTIAGALEFEIDKLDLFAEFTSIQSGGAGPLDAAGKVYVTPGLKIGYLRPFILEGGVSFGLTDNVPDLEIIAGLGLSGRLFTPRKVTTGTIAGRVIDAATGRALAATVSFPGEDGLGPFSTDADRGTFTASKVRAGWVTARAAARGYLPAEQSVEVVAGRTSQLELALALEPTTGTIAGLITDAATGRPVAARIEFPGSRLAGVDAGTEEFELLDVPAGSYEIRVIADGYLPASSTVKVLPEAETRADFELVRKGVTIPLKVFFDFDQATLKPESKPALEGAAKIMRENAGIRVEIQGHTDNKGTAEYNRRLSQQRAQAVVDYLVDTLGIERPRLSARGFGLDKPIATNDTEEGQAQNRRAEFIVLD
jgi:outer membrane protein OmpA-like peptidoglycan-associated protein